MAATHPTIYHRPNGVKFVAGANSIEFATRWKSQPGDIVSFKYTGWLLATQKPKLPTLYRMRHDISWEEVVLRFKEKRPSNSGILKERFLIYQNDNTNTNRRHTPKTKETAATEGKGTLAE